MGKKDKLAMDPVSAHRKEEKKKLAAKIKKQRDERKEAQYKADPKALQSEINKLKSRQDLREASGTNAKIKAKIESLSTIKDESERRRKADAEEEAQRPAAPEVTLDLSPSRA